MFKLLGALLAGAMLVTAAPVFAVSGPSNNDIDIVAPMVFANPAFLDVSTNDVVIEKQFFDNGVPILTTLTLIMQQDIKGKISGVATFTSTRGVSGNPSISLPVTIPLKGKTKGTSFAVKGSVKIAGGADFHSRTVGLTASGNLQGQFDYAELTGDATSESAATLYTSANISGLGFGYSLEREITQLGDFNFHIQPAKDTAGLKSLPNGSGYFEIALPSFYAMGKGSITLDSANSNYVGTHLINDTGALNRLAPFFVFEATLTPAVFSIKAKGVSAVIYGQQVQGYSVDMNDNLVLGSIFEPLSYSIKSKLATTNADASPWTYAGFRILYPEGPGGGNGGGGNGGGGNGGGGGGNGGGTPVAVPNTPTNVTATRILNQIEIRWIDQSTNEVGFIIQYKLTNQSWESPQVLAFVEPANSQVTTHFVNEFDPQGSYNFRVVAVNRGGASNFAEADPIDIFY